MAAAAAAAAGVIGAAYLSSRAQKNAAKSQERSTDKALAYEKEQDQYLRSRYEKEDAREEEARRGYQMYLASQGKGPSPAPDNMNPVAVAARAAVMQPGYSAQPAQPTMRDMAPGAPAPADAPAPMAAGHADVSTMPTVADLGQWNKWEPYLQQNRA